LTTARGEKKRGGVLREEFGNPERRLAYYMVLPALLIILIVAFYPVLSSVWLSLHPDVTIVQTGTALGLDNYTEMFANEDFRIGLRNTVLFTVISVFFEFIIGLGIALALLKPTILVALLFRTLDAYRVYDLFWAMSNRQLESLSTFVYKSIKVSQLLYGVGTAAAVFIFITAFLLALFFIYGLGMQTATED
jgi:ABC-type sugar transport system permease subunit